jgi:flagellar motility protein MotE (MotC chaperone)
MSEIYALEQALGERDIENRNLKKDIRRLREALAEARIKIESRAINLEENNEVVLSEEYYRVVQVIDEALSALQDAKEFTKGYADKYFY